MGFGEFIAVLGAVIATKSERNSSYDIIGFIVMCFGLWLTSLKEKMDKNALGQKL